MAVLRSAGVVASRREGTWIHYRLEDQEDPHRAEHLRALIRVFGKEKTLQRDVEKLLKSKRPESCR
jgi:DNA-binding transcriptional ArsR family regulator